MASIAKTVGSFDKVLATCKSIGASYQPKAPGLTPTALSQLLERAQQSLRAATETRIAYRMAVNDRKESFKGLRKLAVRVVRMMAAFTKGDDPHYEDAVLIKNKFNAVRRKKSAEQTQPGEVAQATRSSGRLSYDQQMETFSNLVQLVSQIGSYDVAEPDLTLEALQQKLDELHATSDAVIKANTAFIKARLERNEVIFGKEGILATRKAVKDYILSAFGRESLPSDQVAAGM